MKTIKGDSLTIGIVDSETKITRAQDMLDIMASFSYFENAQNLALIIGAQSLSDKFFDLKSGFAGEILQKFSNYHVKLAIIGDFSNVQNKSLRDFIRECNRGRQVFFVGDEQEAQKRLQAS